MAQDVAPASNGLRGQRTFNTGVAYFDEPMRGTASYSRWKAKLERSGVTIGELGEQGVALGEGEIATWPSASELWIDPKSFRRIDMIHENRHFNQVMRARRRGYATDLTNPRTVVVGEIDAYLFEEYLGMKYGFDPEYLRHNARVLEDYLGSSSLRSDLWAGRSSIVGRIEGLIGGDPARFRQEYLDYFRRYGFHRYGPHQEGWRP